MKTVNFLNSLATHGYLIRSIDEFSPLFHGKTRQEMQAPPPSFPFPYAGARLFALIIARD